MRIEAIRRMRTGAGTGGRSAVLCLSLVLAAVIVPTAASAGDDATAARAADSNVIEGSYIVVYEDSAGHGRSGDRSS